MKLREWSTSVSSELPCSTDKFSFAVQVLFEYSCHKVKEKAEVEVIQKMLKENYPEGPGLKD